jgi:hypothetical protein
MVSENRALRRTFAPKEEEVLADSRRLRNEELHNLYASRNNVGVTNKGVGWPWHVERKAEMIN